MSQFHHTQPTKCNTPLVGSSPISGKFVKYKQFHIENCVSIFSVAILYKV